MKTNSKLAHRLKHRVTFQNAVTEEDASGGYVESWKDFATVWAEVHPRSGGESLADEQVQANRRISVVVRYREDISTKMRIKYKDRAFAITSILNPYEENVLLEITAQEEDVK